MLDQSDTSYQKKKLHNVMQLKGAFHYVIELRQCLQCIYFQCWHMNGSTWQYLWSLCHWGVVVMSCLVMWAPSLCSRELLLTRAGSPGLSWGHSEVCWHSLVTRLLVSPAAGASPQPPYWLASGVTSPGARDSTYQHFTDQGVLHYSRWITCLLV